MTASAWLAGKLLEGRLDGKTNKLYRIVLLEPHAGLAHLLEVERNVIHHSTRVPLAARFEQARATLHLVAECIRLPDMSWIDSELSDETRASRDARFSLIQPLVEPSVVGRLMIRRQRAELLGRRARDTGVSVVQLRRLLTRYWWFGCDANALIELRSRRGAPGQPRQVVGKAKRGRPNAMVLERPSTRLRGVNVDKRHLRVFLDALRNYWVKDNMTLSEAYDRMERELYRKSMTDRDGHVTHYQIDKRLIPTKAQFYYHASRLIRENELREARSHALDYATKLAPRSGAARSIATGPGDIFDIDATEFNFELTSSWNPRTRIGRPTTYFVLDRYSTAIVGVYAEPRAERWEGYRRALYSAFTTKTALLDQLGFVNEDADIWPISAVPNAVFSDRGPARSNDALAALVKQLKLEKATAPTKRPDLNAVVESMHKKVQDKLSTAPGGFKRGGDTRMKQRASNARRGARFNERQFMRELVAVIHEHNTASLVPHLLNSEMIAAGVKPVPQDIFVWGLENSAVDYLRFRNPTELYALLLPFREVSVSTRGVRYKKAYYDSPDLQLWRLDHRGKAPKVTVYIDADPRILHWKPAPQRWDELVMSAADQQRTGGMSWDEIELHLRKVSADSIVIDRARSKRGVLSRAKEQNLREIAAHGPSGSYKPKEQSVSRNRSLASRQKQSQHEAQGRETMGKLAVPLFTGQENHRGSVGVELGNQATSPPTRASGEPSLDDLHREFFDS